MQSISRALRSGRFSVRTPADSALRSAARSVVDALEPRRLMAVVTVDTTADNIAFDNDVTLREAILFVNGTLGYGSLSAGEQALVDLTEPLGTNDTIRFNIPGSGVQTISPTSALPDVRAKVLIDGYSQPGASANTLAVGNDATLLIELDGNGAGATDSGLVFDVGSDGSTVRGMVINRFEDAGVLTINTENITIAGNFIGTDPTGTLDRGNDRGVALAYTSGATIGGSAAADRNVISGNDTDGIQIFDDDGNFVYGNYIGTNAAGTGAIANDENGVSITSRENVVGGTAAGAGNLISGNGLNGIALADGDSDSAERTLIQGNIIGLASDGTALGNGKSGISMTLNTIDNVVGGTIAGARNVISGNLESGISLEESTRNTIQGNFIGTNLAGDATIGNTQYGIVLNESDNTVIGGLAAGAGNVITGNRLDGIALGSSSFTTIQGNRIGVFATGTTGSGNGGNGVLISEDSRDNQIGGAVSAAANIIAFNEAAGVNIFTYQGDAERNVIRRNSIHSNGGLGIDFTGIISGGITPNDPMDGDGGSNNQQNFPVLVSAVASASGLNIVGTFNSLPNTTFILEFFSNTALDPSGMGEGERYLGSVGVITDAAGNASFNTTLAVTLGSDVYISATATNTTTSPYGDTSEFAQSIEAVLPRRRHPRQACRSMT